MQKGQKLLRLPTAIGVTELYSYSIGIPTTDSKLSSLLSTAVARIDHTTSILTLVAGSTTQFGGWNLVLSKAAMYTKQVHAFLSDTDNITPNSFETAVIYN